MADNITVTPGTGASIAADEIGGHLHQRVKLIWGPNDTANEVDVATGKPMPIQLRTATGVDLIKTTAPVAGDPALVVAISPNGVNANMSDGSLQTGVANTGAPVVGLDPYSQYEFVPFGMTSGQVLGGGSGTRYDYLAGVLIIPTTAAAGVVQIQDGNGTAMTIFAGGATTALADLKPFMVPLGIHALAATTPGWRIITNANVSAIGIGRFA